MKLILLNLLLLTSLPFCAQTDEQSIIGGYQDSIAYLNTDNIVVDLEKIDTSFFVLDSVNFYGNLHLNIQNIDLTHVESISVYLYKDDFLINSVEIQKNDFETMHNLSRTIENIVFANSMNITLDFVLYDSRIVNYSKIISTVVYE